MKQSGVGVMGRWTKAFAVGVFLALCGCTAQAQTASDFQYELGKDEVGEYIIIQQYLGTRGGKVVIPAKIEGYTVGYIGENAFSEDPSDNFGTRDYDRRKERITEVVIPDTVFGIGLSAFFGCRALTKVTFPKELVDLWPSAFFKTGLTSVTLPAKLKWIAGSAFHDCPNLKSVTIPESVIAIGRGAFSGCKELTTVKLPSHPLTYYDTYGKEEEPSNDAFRDCPKLSLSMRNAIKESGYQGIFTAY